MGISFASAVGIFALAAGCAASSAGAFEKVRGWGPLELGMTPEQVRGALVGGGIEHQEKFIMKDGTTRITLTGEGGAGVCYFSAEKRLTQILFTGIQTRDEAEVAATEARARRRHGPPGEVLTRRDADGIREERVLIWRGDRTVLTVTLVHYLPDGDWVAFEGYTPE